MVEVDIRIIKDHDGVKIGDIITAKQSDAQDYIDNGIAEYLVENNAVELKSSNTKDPKKQVTFSKVGENSENSEFINKKSEVVEDKIEKSKTNMIVSNDVSFNQNMLKKPKTNYSNYSNLTNYSNYSNLTSILGNPKSKSEAVYFLLYAEPKSELDKILEVSGYSKNAFYNLKSRDSNILSEKNGDKNKVLYDITPEIKEQIDLRIKQKEEQKEKDKKEKEDSDKVIEKNLEIYDELKEIISKDLDGDDVKTPLIKIDNNFAWLDLLELKELNYNIFDYFIDNPDYFSRKTFDRQQPKIDMIRLSIIKSLSIKELRAAAIGVSKRSLRHATSSRITLLCLSFTNPWGLYITPVIRCIYI